MDNDQANSNAPVIMTSTQKSTNGTRAQYEKRPEVRLKRYIKNHDDGYIRKRREYSMDPKVKQRRQTLNKRRRQLCSILITMVKNGLVADKEGNTYRIEAGRLVQNDINVVKIDKLGNLHLIKFDTRIDLENEQLDDPITSKDDEEFMELLEKYKKGELVVDKQVKEKVHINVNGRNDGDLPSADTPDATEGT
jgi:hypothetical protein